MQVVHNNESILIENTVAAINIIFTKINKSIEKKNVVFSHLIVDGEEVFENHEAYILEHLSEINKVEIMTKYLNDMFWETMRSLLEYLKNAIPSIEKLVEEGSQNFSSESWIGISHIAEGMQWILQFKKVVESSLQKPINWLEITEIIEVCEGNVVQLLEAVEQQDTILISDILLYEIVPTYKSFTISLDTALKVEEFLEDVN